MLKTLKTLIRIQDSHVNDFQRKLAEAQNKEDELRNRLAQFIENMQREAVLATQDNLMAQSYSSYIDHATEQRKKLESLVRDTEAITAIARDNLLAAHQELKKLKKIQQQKQEQADFELSLEEQKAIDDIVQSTNGGAQKLF